MAGQFDPDAQLAMNSVWLAMLRWPTVALIVWGCAWALRIGLLQAGAGAGLATSAAVCLGLLAIALVQGRWRRAIMALGFPLSWLLVLPGSQLPSWLWLLLLLALIVVYPLRAWRDAPWFPTPQDGLQGLAEAAQLQAPRILDAGCGSGAGLIELRAQYPDAELIGIEWSIWLCLLSWWRCRRWARISRADLWKTSWADYQMVYIFQRPETLAPALEKARKEMRPGSWLVSLEFSAAGLAPTKVLQGAGRRPVWMYQMPEPVGRSRHKRN